MVAIVFPERIRLFHGENLVAGAIQLLRHLFHFRLRFRFCFLDGLVIIAVGIIVVEPGRNLS
jgi:hypothetical protein